MVGLPLVHASNALLCTTVPSPSAVFVGGTSGIGLATLKELVSRTKTPSIYLVGRNESAGTGAIDQCKQQNANAQIVFLKADCSLIDEVDAACMRIKEMVADRGLDFLVLSTGYLNLEGMIETKEGLNRELTVTYYSRMRFISQLLPLRPSHILSILGGTKEDGPLITGDLGLKNKHTFFNAVKHGITMTSLAFEHLASTHPDTAFVHAFPGTVKTGLFTKSFGRFVSLLLDWIVLPLLTPLTTPLEEVAARQLFHLTSARYPPAAVGERKERGGVVRPEGVDIANAGKGWYLLDPKGECGEGKVMEEMRSEGWPRKVWEHTTALSDEAAKRGKKE